MVCNRSGSPGMRSGLSEVVCKYYKYIQLLRKIYIHGKSGRSGSGKLPIIFLKSLARSLKPDSQQFGSSPN